MRSERAHVESNIRMPPWIVSDMAMGNSAEKKRRLRTTANQKLVLESYYRQNSHPTKEVKCHIAALVGLNIRRLTVWFQNRRAREKRSESQMTRFRTGVSW
jgi:hypothetical protein